MNGHGRRTIEVVNRARERDWQIAIATSLLAVAALVVGSSLGNIRAHELHNRVGAGICALALLFFGTIAVRRTAAAIDQLVALQSLISAAPAVRLVATGVGYVIVIFAEFGLLGVSITHLLVGAGLVGVVLGIAAQQSLGNVFAAIVLLLARPFTVGDRVRIRSGALGGIFDATITGISLSYVSLQTDDGPLKIPNAVMLATAVGLVSLTDEARLSPEVHFSAEHPPTSP
jgi:small-conductance mechanosensitive channel